MARKLFAFLAISVLPSFVYAARISGGGGSGGTSSSTSSISSIVAGYGLGGGGSTGTITIYLLPDATSYIRNYSGVQDAQASISSFTANGYVRLNAQNVTQVYNQDDEPYYRVSNMSTGTTVASVLQVVTDSATFSFAAFGSHYNGSRMGIATAGFGEIRSATGTPGIVMMTAGGPMYFGTNDTLALTFDTSQNTTLSGDTNRITKSTNTIVDWLITNNSSGTAALARHSISNGGITSQFAVFGATYSGTRLGINSQSMTEIRSSGAENPGLLFDAGGSTGSIYMGTNGILAQTIDPNQLITLEKKLLIKNSLTPSGTPAVTTAIKAYGNSASPGYTATTLGSPLNSPGSPVFTVEQCAFSSCNNRISLNYTDSTDATGYSVPGFYLGSYVNVGQSSGGGVALGDRGPLKFAETVANGQQYTALRGSSTITTNYTYTLPPVDGTSGQSLTTNGIGDLGWSTISSGSSSTSTPVGYGTIYTSSDSVVQTGISTTPVVLKGVNGVYQFNSTTLSSTNATITISSAAAYWVFANFTSTGTGTFTQYFDIRVNGATTPFKCDDSPSVRCTMGGVVSLNANDVVAIYTYTNLVGASTITVNNAQFCVHSVGGVGSGGGSSSGGYALQPATVTITFANGTVYKADNYSFGAFVCDITSGCVPGTQYQVGTTSTNIIGSLFSAGATSYAEGEFPLPENYITNSTFTAQIVWTSTYTTNGSSMTWWVEMKVSTAGTLPGNISWGTPVTVNATHIAPYANNFTTELAAITPGGTLTGGASLFVRVSRRWASAETVPTAIFKRIRIAYPIDSMSARD